MKNNGGFIMKETKILKLNNLSIGLAAKIHKISATGKLKRKLLDMGLSKGAKIIVKGKAPMGDPLEVKVRGYNLTLRKEEAKKIEVKGAKI